MFCNYFSVLIVINIISTTFKKNIMSNESGGFKFLKGVIIGGAIGAALGMLFAPKSGKETREKLMKEADRLKDELEKYADDFSDKANEMRADIEQKLKEVKSKIEETADGFKEKIREKEEQMNGQMDV